ncbi:MAG: hypothetical protein QOF76_1693 [Solirubrobacteraceae bacterium]|nr:hypothetical protein [Solirubrobacteraceae bacterium]
MFNSWDTRPQRSSKRWSRESEPQSVPAETGLSRATIVDSENIDEPAAKAWLDSLDDEASQEAIESAVGVLNNAIRVHRAASTDVTVREVSPETALTLRAGYGVGEEVAEGAWTSARDLNWSGKRRNRRQRRIDTLRPQERLAAVLGGRDAVLACEEMALRARLDVDAERFREAALQTHLAVEAAVAEFKAYVDMDSVARRRDDLEAARSIAAGAANEALEGGLSSDTVEQVVECLRQVEALLRARSATASY